MKVHNVDKLLFQVDRVEAQKGIVLLKIDSLI